MQKCFLNPCLCHVCFYFTGKNKSHDEVQSQHGKGLPKVVDAGMCDKLPATTATMYHQWAIQSLWWPVKFASLYADDALSVVLLFTYLAAQRIHWYLWFLFAEISSPWSALLDVIQDNLRLPLLLTWSIDGFWGTLIAFFQMNSGKYRLSLI